MNAKTKKLLTRISAILLNVFSVLLGIVVLFSSLASIKAVESFITVNLFGGYPQEEVNVGEDEEYTDYFKTEFESVAELIEHNKGVCQDVEAEGAVLLKNENDSLPLEDGNKVSLFGVNSVKPVTTVDAGADKIGSNGDEPNYKDTFTQAGLEVNPTLYGWYEKNYNTYKNPVAPSNFQPVGLKDAKWTEISAEARNSYAEYNDAVIFIIGRGGNEGVDMTISGGSTSTYTDGDFLQLSVAEKSVLDQLKTLRKSGDIKNLVIIINSAAPLETNLMDSDEVDSILWVGMTGTTGVKAVADILVGKVNPSGRLSDMWYVNNCYDPVLTNYGDFSHDGNKYVVYQEGIYLGYRYAETRYEDVVIGTPDVGEFNYSQQIAYPFGYGLSYTQFEYSNFKVTYNAKLDQYTVSVTVTNTGDEDGKEVVQVYLQQPYTQYDKDNHIEKASVELVGFEKTDVLKADGGSETVKVVVEGKYFAAYDAYGIGSYYRDAGDYYLTVGKDAHDAVNNILAAKEYSPAKNGSMDADGNADLVYSTYLSDDETTYVTASNTGYEIKNLFDNADPNRWNDGGSNHVDYITRANWTGTVKLAYNINHAKTNGLQATIKNSKTITDGRALDSNGGVAATKGTGRNNDYPTYGKNADPEDPEHLNLIDLRSQMNLAGEEEWIPYEDERWEKLLDQLTWEETVNIVSNGRRRTIGVDSISKPVTIDHNGSSGFAEPYNYLEESNRGLAVKNNDPDKSKHAVGYPCSGIIAATFNKELAYAVGNAMGEDSLWSGMSAIYGFGLNIHRSAYHGRYAAYYSADPYLTGVMSGQSSLGAWDKGCYVYNKHLVLDEQEVNRSSHEAYIYEEALRQIYLRPFEIAIDIGDAMCVMTAFNRVGSIWAGNHYNLCTEFLRNEAGMQGFAVTDWYPSTGMGIVGGILAGNDLPDGDGANSEFNGYGPGNGYAELAWAMRESAHRILFTVVHSNAMNGIGTGTRFITHTPTWVIALHAIEITVGILFALSAAAYITMRCLNRFLPEKPAIADIK